MKNIIVSLSPTRTAREVGLALADGFRQAGQTVRSIDSGERVPPGGSVLGRAKSMALEARFRAVVLRENPRIVVFIKGEGVPGRLLDWLKRRRIGRVNWYIDDPPHIQTSMKLSPMYDLFLTCAPDCVRAHLRAGCPHVRFLTFATDPRIYYPIPLSRQDLLRYGATVAFAGTVVRPRVKYLRRIVRHGVRIWSEPYVQGYDFTTGRMTAQPLELDSLDSAWAGRSAWGGELAKVYSASKMGVNLHVSKSSMNMRDFEVTACRCLLLSDQPNVVCHSFEPGKEFVPFQSPDELATKVSYYARHASERNGIRTNGYKRCLAEHTYRHRALRIIRHVAKDLDWVDLG